MTEKKSKKNIEYLFGLSLKQAIAVTFFGVLVAISKFADRVPLNIPGHSGLIWMAIFSLCCLMFREGRAGTLAGFVAGMLAVVLFPDKTGLLTFFKYFLPGAAMDFIAFASPFFMKRWYTVALTAAFCHLTKLLVNLAAGVIMNLPMGFLALGLGFSTFGHFLFGFAGGLLGYLAYSNTLLKKLKAHLST